jgi:hypothetical protein
VQVLFWALLLGFFLDDYDAFGCELNWLLATI